MSRRRVDRGETLGHPVRVPRRRVPELRDGGSPLDHAAAGEVQASRRCEVRDVGDLVTGVDWLRRRVSDVRLAAVQNTDRAGVVRPVDLSAA